MCWFHKKCPNELYESHTALQRNVPVKIKWVNELYDSTGKYVPHLFANEIDQTLHW